MVSYINPFAGIEQNNYYDKTIDDVQVEVGSSNRFVDGFRNLVSIPTKILLWNTSLNSGNVSEETIQKMKEYLDENNLHDVHVSVNQYKPQEVWRRTFSNPKTSLLTKMTVGIVNSIIMTVSIPKLTGFPGDHYNAFSNTVHLFSNDAAIALHECGHAKDFNSRMNPSLYALTQKLPYVGSLATLMHEAIATSNALSYLNQKNNKSLLAHSLKILVPAYATYIAATVLPDINAKAFELIAAYQSNDIVCRVAAEHFLSDFKTYMIGMTAILLTGHALGRVMAAGVGKDKES